MNDSHPPIRYHIAPQVFALFPHYRRTLVVARGVTNCPSPPELEANLRTAEQDMRAELEGADIASHPCIRAWREAYRALGVRPAEFRPSMEAMLRRVLNGHLLPSINALVDIGNLVSLRCLLPIGGHAIDQLQDDVALRQAHGREVFIPIGSDRPEHPDAGEFIFTEGDTVLTRRWTWRQSSRTMTTLGTRAIGYNVDILPPAGLVEAQAACNEIMELVARFCGGRSAMHMLSQEAPLIELV